MNEDLNEVGRYFSLPRKALYNRVGKLSKGPDSLLMPLLQENSNRTMTFYVFSLQVVDSNKRESVITTIMKIILFAKPSLFAYILVYCCPP